MVGKPVLMEVERKDVKPGETVLEVKDLRVRSSRGIVSVDGLSFSIRAGEIYGIAGVEGNGQSELVRCIAEGAESESGEILLEGLSTRRWSVRKRRERALPTFPRIGRSTGCCSPSPSHESHPGPALQTAVCNAAAAHQYARHPRVGRQIIARYDIRTRRRTPRPTPSRAANQQKAVVARELSAEPHLLVASQPTRGVDIGATEFIHRQLMQARAEGKAVLLVSAISMSCWRSPIASG